MMVRSTARVDGNLDRATVAPYHVESNVSRKPRSLKMNGIAPRFVRFSFALLGLMTLGWVLTGQAAKPAHQSFPLVTDWTHSHLVFSQPATVEQARLIGNEPRFWQQMERRKQRLLVRDE